MRTWGILAAVGQDANALLHASAELQADLGIVLVAVERNGVPRLYADPRLKADKDIVLAAIDPIARPLEWLLHSQRPTVASSCQQSDRMQRPVARFRRAALDRDFALAAVEHNGNALSMLLQS